MTKKIVVGSDQKPTSDQLLEMYEKLDGQVKEIRGQMRRGALTSRHIQALIEHRNPFPTREGVAMSISFKHDKARNGWKLLEDVPFSAAFTPVFVEFLKSVESSVNGEVMTQRAKKLNANPGQHHAEYLLEHQELIPKELRGKHLVFPGTVWLDGDGRRNVPGLEWGGGRWYLFFDWLSSDWGGGDLLIRPRE